jgi:hypothetical protein
MDGNVSKRFGEQVLGIFIHRSWRWCGLIYLQPKSNLSNSLKFNGEERETKIRDIVKTWSNFESSHYKNLCPNLYDSFMFYLMGIRNISVSVISIMDATLSPNQEGLSWEGYRDSW